MAVTKRKKHSVYYTRWKFFDGLYFSNEYLRNVFCMLYIQDRERVRRNLQFIQYYCSLPASLAEFNGQAEQKKIGGSKLSVVYVKTTEWSRELKIRVYRVSGRGMIRMAMYLWEMPKWKEWSWRWKSRRKGIASQQGAWQLKETCLGLEKAKKLHAEVPGSKEVPLHCRGLPYKIARTCAMEGWGSSLYSWVCALERPI